jgi:hypothetical protein
VTTLAAIFGGIVAFLKALPVLSDWWGQVRVFLRQRQEKRVDEEKKRVEDGGRPDWG